MYTLNEINKGIGLYESGITKIYMDVEKNFYTCEDNNYMKLGYVWGYGHWEGDTPVINQI